MIFKRLADGIRRQDWFTVMVEVLIVVVGVYIGIFIGEAANERTLYADVNRTLGVLQVQLREDQATLDNIIGTHRSGRQKFEIATDVLSQSPVNTAAFGEASPGVLSVHLSFFPNHSGYQTLRQLGYLAEVRDPQLQLLLANLFEQVYVRQAGLAERMDDVGLHYMLSVRDVYWDGVEGRFIGNEAEGAVRMRNAIVALGNYSFYYRRHLEQIVRPKLVKTIEALDAYLGRGQS